MVEYQDVRMDLMSSKDVAKYLKKKDMVILPVGCVEMHGPKIPLACDTIHAWATSILLAKKWKCLVLPPVYYAYPGASGPWPGTVDISPEITASYLKAITLALIKGGFNRVVLYGTHGPLAWAFQSVMRSILQETGKVVVGMQSEVMPDDLMKKELGYDGGEDILVLASLKILGLHGAYDPKANREGPREFPYSTVGPLRKHGASVPWLFKADYQHTGIRKGLSINDADKAIKVMKKAIDRMGSFPKLYATYQKQIKKLLNDKPWNKDSNWTL